MHLLNLLKISLIVSSIVLLVLLITPIAGRRYSNRWRYWLWLILSIMLILPVNINFQDAPLTISPNSIKEMSKFYKASNNESESKSVLLLKGTHFSSKEALSIPTAKKSTCNIKLQNIFILLWTVGVIVCFMWNIINYIIYKKNICRWSYKIRDEKIKIIFEEIKRDMHINSNIELNICCIVNSPMLIGILRPTILLPKNNFTDNELKHIFAHELTHYKRFDLCYKVLFLIARSIHWFNPLIYLMNKMALADIEICCDLDATNSYNSECKKEYAQTIINVMKLNKNRDVVLTTNFNGGKQFMKNRIKALIKPQKRKKGVVILTSILLLVLIVQSLVACQSNDMSEKESDKNVEESSNSEAVNIGDGDMEAPFEAEGIDFSGVKYILAEKEKDTKLEKAIIKKFYNENEKPEFRYLYNRIDLNGDGVNETFVLLLGPYFSGTGGSTAAIFREEKDEYILVSTNTLVRSPIIVSTTKTNGWNDLIMQVSGGGYPVSFNLLKFDGKKYPLNPSIQPQLEKGSKVVGTGIIANKLTPDIGIEYKSE